MATIIKANGLMQYVEPKNGSNFQLEELQEIVGGYIEVIYLNGNGGRLMVCNEEGKLNRLPYNEKATELYGHRRDYIVGDVLVCDNNQIK